MTKHELHDALASDADDDNNNGNGNSHVDTDADVVVTDDDAEPRQKEQRATQSPPAMDTSLNVTVSPNATGARHAGGSSGDSGSGGQTRDGVDVDHNRSPGVAAKQVRQSQTAAPVLPSFPAIALASEPTDSLLLADGLRLSPSMLDAGATSLKPSKEAMLKALGL